MIWFPAIASRAEGGLHSVNTFSCCPKIAVDMDKNKISPKTKSHTINSFWGFSISHTNILRFKFFGDLAAYKTRDATRYKGVFSCFPVLSSSFKTRISQRLNWQFIHGERIRSQNTKFSQSNSRIYHES